MREKVTCGWTLGKDGFYHVNPRWKDPEETFTLPRKSVVEVATLVMEKEEVGMVDSKRVAEIKIKQPAQKKNPGTLGPRGFRRNGGKNNYGGFQASNYPQEEHKVSGLALVLKNMKKEGYGAFPDDFKPPLYESKKTFSYVRQDLYTTVTMNCYKLAESYREGPTVSCFNPFAQGMPFGESQPLPR